MRFQWKLTFMLLFKYFHKNVGINIINNIKNELSTRPLWHSKLLYTQQSKSLISTAVQIFWSMVHLQVRYMSSITWAKFWNVTHLILILFLLTLVLAPACTHKYEIILFYNTLAIILLITYIYFSYFCLISLFLFNLSKPRLFTCHVCFQFKV
jgi:hypothetical protein